MATWIAIVCWTAFVGGLLFFLGERKGRKRNNKDEITKSSVYSLQHGRLNIRLPAESMWMNMGYWKDQQDDPLDFPKACKSLLEKIFTNAGLLPPQFNNPPEPASQPSINILDIGFGCADQTLELFHGPAFSNLHIKSYIGLTNSKPQFTFAQTRLASLGLTGEYPSPLGPSKISTHCQDAALPERWPRTLRDEIRAMKKSTTRNSWILGLDSMYHLSPSRIPLLEYAHDEVGASFMGFDLLLAKPYEEMGFSRRWVLRAVCLLTSVPYRNLMTEGEYREMLREVGYGSEGVELEDVSRDVFSPLVRFLDFQHAQLKAMGMGLGGLRVARHIFGWWAETGVVRGYVVVARHEG